MSGSQKRIQTAIDSILNSFFGKEEITTITDQLFAYPEEEPVNSKQSPVYERSKDENRLLYDILITSAQNRLSASDFIEFQKSFADTITGFGDYDFALSLYELLIKQIKTEPEFITLKAEVYLALGNILRIQAKWQTAKTYIKKAKKIFNELNEIEGLVNCENLLGTLHGECGEISEAKHHFELALGYLDTADDINLKSKIEINLGIINNIQGNPVIAIQYFKKSLKYFLQKKNFARISEIKHNMGMAYIKMNEFEKAFDEFDQSIAVSITNNNQTMLGISYLSKGYLHALCKQFTLADYFLDLSMNICMENGDNLSIADIYKTRGIIHKSKNDFKLSEAYFLTSMRINKELGNELNEAETAAELALLYKENSDTEKSKLHFNRAINYYKKINASSELELIAAKMT